MWIINRQWLWNRGMSKVYKHIAPMYKQKFRRWSVITFCGCITQTRHQQSNTHTHTLKMARLVMGESLLKNCCKFSNYVIKTPYGLTELLYEPGPGVLVPKAVVVLIGGLDKGSNWFSTLWFIPMDWSHKKCIGWTWNMDGCFEFENWIWIHFWPNSTESILTLSIMTAKQFFVHF